MSLAPCRECGQQISTEAARCPQCGAPRWSSTEPPKLLTLLMALIAAGVVISVVAAVWK